MFQQKWSEQGHKEEGFSKSCMKRGGGWGMWGLYTGIHEGVFSKCNLKD